MKLGLIPVYSRRCQGSSFRSSSIPTPSPSRSSLYSRSREHRERRSSSRSKDGWSHCCLSLQKGDLSESGFIVSFSFLLLQLSGNPDKGRTLFKALSEKPCTCLRHRYQENSRSSEAFIIVSYHTFMILRKRSCLRMFSQTQMSYRAH